MSRLKRERTKIHEFGDDLMENEFISPNFLLLTCSLKSLEKFWEK